MLNNIFRLWKNASLVNKIKILRLFATGQYEKCVARPGLSSKSINIQFRRFVYFWFPLYMQEMASSFRAQSLVPAKDQLPVELVSVSYC